MTDIERYRPPADSWVDVLPQVGDLATKLSQTDFVPKALKGKPAEVAAAILTGRELNIGPMTALAHLHVIHGTVGMSAQLMRQLILSAGHHIRYIETTNTRCVVEGRRRDEDEWQTVTFTAEQARAAKIQLGDYPEDKLVARATSRLARRMFADCLGGVPYLTDELEAPEAPAQTNTANTKRTARRATAPSVPADEPPLDVPAPTPPPATGDAPARPRGGGEATDGPGTADEPPLDEHPPGGISPGQSRLLHSLFNQLDIKDRPTRMGITCGVIQRQIETSNELTKDEAKRVIDELNRLIDQRETQQAVAVVEDIVDGEIVEESLPL